MGIPGRRVTSLPLVDDKMPADMAFVQLMPFLLLCRLLNVSQDLQSLAHGNCFALYNFQRLHALGIEVDNSYLQDSHGGI